MTGDSDSNDVALAIQSLLLVFRVSLLNLWNRLGPGFEMPGCRVGLVEFLRV